MTQQRPSYVYTEENWTQVRKQNLYTSNSIIQNNQNVQTYQIATTNGWIKMWYIQTAEYYLVIKKNKVLTSYDKEEPWQPYAQW